MVVLPALDPAIASGLLLLVDDFRDSSVRLFFDSLFVVAALF